jgi:type II secretory pathway predicted ATPase ExeA
MLGEVMQHYGITRPFRDAGYFETEHHRRISQELAAAIRRGGLMALCGIVGCGKTTLLARTREALQREDQILVSRSLAVDKAHVNLKTLIMALFYDLSVEDAVKVPAQAERRERLLLSLIEQRGRPVALFVDDAHDLNGQTLVQLKRLIELVRGAGEALSVVLAGHPKLKHDMGNPKLEEIGARATVFELDGIRGEQEAYIRWLLGQCAQDEVETLISEAAIERLAERLATPLQIERYLTLAFEQAHEIAEKPVSAALVDSVLAPGLDDLEPRLARHGYNARILAHELDIRQAEVRAFLRGTLAPARTEEIHKQLLAKGLPA